MADASKARHIDPSRGLNSPLSPPVRQAGQSPLIRLSHRHHTGIAVQSDPVEVLRYTAFSTHTLHIAAEVGSTEGWVSCFQIPSITHV